MFSIPHLSQALLRLRSRGRYVNKAVVSPLFLSIVIIAALLPVVSAEAAVVFDAASESHTGTTGASATFSWTHTPVGTPRGVLIFVFNRNDPSGNDTTSVTYGGTDVPLIDDSVARDTTASTEGGSVQAYFLGSSIPTGAQTVQVTEGDTYTSAYAVAITVTANDDTSYAGIVTEGENQTLTEENIDDDSLTGTNSVRFAAILSGAAAVPPDGANSTNIAGIDFGAFVNGVYRETTAGQGSRPIGASYATSDDVAAIYIAIAEAYYATQQINFQFFEGSGALPYYSLGTSPVVESTDITHTNNTSTADQTVAYPAYSAGDLVIQAVASDAAVSHTPPANGPNGETLFSLVDNESPGAGGPTLSAIYYIATAGQSAGDLTWTFSAAETSSGETIVVPAGEFNAVNPINAISAAGLQTVGTGPTVTMPSFDSTYTSDNGRVVAFGGDDADPMGNPFSPTGWTDRDGAGRDDGAQNSWVATRDAAIVHPETIASADFQINDGVTGDTAVVIGFIINPPLGAAQGRSPLESAGVDVSLGVDTDYGWQFRVKNLGNLPVSNEYKIQYYHSEGTATWTDVTSSSNVVRATLTTDFANGDDALRYIGGTGVFVDDNNAALESSGTVTLGASTLGINRAFEGHLNFQIVSGDVANNDTIQLRVVYGDGSPLEGYLEAPTITVSTGGGVSQPTVLTGTSGNISPTSATLFGNIINDGGDSITDYGFATSSDAHFLTDVATTSLGTGSLGAYSGAVKGLTEDTTYFYRAYAVNSSGISYGTTRTLFTGNSHITRALRLFEGFIFKLFSGKVILHQR